jgi:hypothetical protein
MRLLRSLAIAVLLFAATPAPARAGAAISLSAGELDPGARFVVTVSLWRATTGAADLVLTMPTGFALDDVATSGDPETLDFVDLTPASYHLRALVRAGEPLTLWFDAHVAADAAPSRLPVPIALTVDGQRMEVSARICCAPWPPPRHLFWLPLVQH